MLMSRRQYIYAHLCFKCCCYSNRRQYRSDRPRTNHKQMTSPSNTVSATLALYNTWLAVKYLCFEYIWIVLNASLMESRFKPVMSYIPLSLSLSLSNLHWFRMRGGGNTPRGLENSHHIPWPLTPADSQQPSQMRQWTYTNTLFLSLKLSCALYFSVLGQAGYRKDK